MRLSRRQLVLGAGSAALLAGCGRLPGQAQPAAKVPHIGVLGTGAPNPTFGEPFRRGLAELGYVEGQNIVIEWRGDDGRAERLAQNVAELVNVKFDLIVATGDIRARAVKEASSTIPIVMSPGVDPVGAGLIESFGRPGGNVTGAIEGFPQLYGKRLELLRELAPGITHLLALGHDPTGGRGLEELGGAARALGLQLRVVRVPTVEALAEALAREASEPIDALIVVHSGFISTQQARIVDFAARKGLPAMYGNRVYVEAGGLAAYGANLEHVYHRAAAYVDKILKGTSPADLPVEQPREFEFVVNMKTARELGITIPHEILLQVTEVIQ
jgi:putative ABC transport system substrate-binding protein